MFTWRSFSFDLKNHLDLVGLIPAEQVAEANPIPVSFFNPAGHNIIDFVAFICQIFSELFGSLFFRVKTDMNGP